jgi:adenylate cyclase class 2
VKSVDKLYTGETMSANGQEIEAKFYVRDLKAIENRLLTLGATCIVPRGFEYNLRFDDAHNSLNRQHKVLRLRKSNDVRMTFKGPARQDGGALARTEIEIVVNDFDMAQQLIENLGYRVFGVYEKYRAMYDFEGAIVTLDELPYGHFVEIEGENPASIVEVAKKLVLNPAAAIPASYQGLFEKLKALKDLPAKNLTFWEFEKITTTPEDLGVRAAD